MDSGMVKIGPVGFFEEEGAWDEKGRCKIAKILLWYDEIRVQALQVQYVAENGTLVMSNRHGPEIANKFAVIKLSLNPEEYLTQISGYYTYFNYTGIVQLKFVTNCGNVYGPYGGKPTDKIRFTPDTAFCFDLGENGFGGFHGSVSMLEGILFSLGVYLRTN